MNITLLERDARRFQKAIERCRNGLGIAFAAFPRGSCGPASELLAAYLRDSGHGTFTYVSGWGCSAPFDGRSHAWLEREDVIVDITADQFDMPGNGAVLFATEGWHSAFSRHRERYEDADFRRHDAGFDREYRKILDTLRVQEADL